jgi:hypothetical protein
MIYVQENDWRNLDVHNTIENMKIENIRTIPFHDLTLPLHNMHPSNLGQQDCTHFCYFPQSVWYDLYKGLNASKFSNFTATLPRRRGGRR